jgi:hypothetical protein
VHEVVSFLQELGEEGVDVLGKVLVCPVGESGRVEMFVDGARHYYCQFGGRRAAFCSEDSRDSSETVDSEVKLGLVDAVSGFNYAEGLEV